jgi:hypothetical protein
MADSHCSSLQHVLSLLSLQCLHQSLPDNGFQPQTFPLLWVPELSPCLSYQPLTASAQNEWTADLWLFTNSPTNSSTPCTALNSLPDWRPSHTNALLFWLTPTQLTKRSLSLSYVTTGGQSASLSWNKAPIWVLWQDFIIVRQLLVCWFGAPSLTRGRFCRLQLLLILASAVIFGSVQINCTEFNLNYQFFIVHFSVINEMP